MLLYSGVVANTKRSRRKPPPAFVPTPDPSQVLPLTHVAYHVLLALAGENRHGYGIIKNVGESTAGAVTLEAGTLYAAIKRMKDEGWIEDAPTRPDEDTRRRVYAITTFGREVLRAEARRLDAMVRLAEDAELLPNHAKKARS